MDNPLIRNSIYEGEGAIYPVLEYPSEKVGVVADNGSKIEMSAEQVFRTKSARKFAIASKIFQDVFCDLILTIFE